MNRWKAHETRADAEFRGPPVTLEVRYGCDAVGMHLATLVDRDIFAGYETFIGEVKPDLVRLIGAGIVVERPAATLTVYEMTVVVLLVRPQSRDPARLAMLSPEPWIDPVVGIERRDDDIGNVAVALGVTRFTRKLDADLPELCWKRCIQDRLGVCVLHLWYRSLSLQV